MTAIRVIDEFTAADAVAAIAAEDAYVKNIGDVITGNLDFSSNEAVNVILELLASAPSTAEGRIYFDTSTKKVYVYKGA